MLTMIYQQMIILLFHQSVKVKQAQVEHQTLKLTDMGLLEEEKNTLIQGAMP